MTKAAVSKLTALILTAAAAATAQAGETQPQSLLNCWDGSFAYSTANVATHETVPHLVRVRLSSQLQEYIGPWVEDEIAGWGVATVDFYLSAAECQRSPESPLVMSCHSRRRSRLELAYDETHDSRRIRGIYFSELTLQTAISGDTLHLEVSMTSEDSTQASSIRMQFPILENGRCRSLKD